MFNFNYFGFKRNLIDFNFKNGQIKTGKTEKEPRENEENIKKNNCVGFHLWFVMCLFSFTDIII